MFWNWFDLSIQVDRPQGVLTGEMSLGKYHDIVNPTHVGNQPVKHQTFVPSTGNLKAIKSKQLTNV